MAPPASAGVLFPDSGVSPTADSAINIFSIAMIVATIVVIAIVLALLAGMRGAKAAAADAPTPVEAGSTRLALGAALIAFAVLSVVGAVALGSTTGADASTAKLDIPGYEPLPDRDPDSPIVTLRNPHQVTPPEGDFLKIYANGQQYLWRYQYAPGSANYAYETLVVPVGVTVQLNVTTSDVVHSWWVPQVGGKVDAVPGYVNQSWFRIDEPGTYRGASTGYSGPNYPSEITTIKAVTPAQFATWLDRHKNELGLAYSELAASRAAKPESKR